jgi:hypothetical protein
VSGVLGARRIVGPVFFNKTITEKDVQVIFGQFFLKLTEGKRLWQVSARLGY